MPKETILVVEDRKDLTRLITLGFQQAGYTVLASPDGETGLKLARRHKPDLVILDVGLPRMDGYEFCRILRQETAVPIIFLSARNKELDQILGLKLGADDYVTKPFSVPVLLARVQAVFRRTGRPAAASAARSVGALEVDLDRHEVRIKGKAVLLTAMEFELLRHLLLADGKVVSRAELLKKIWDYDKDSDHDPRTLEQLVARLRRKLGSERGRLLTLPRLGYRLQSR